MKRQANSIWVRDMEEGRRRGGAVRGREEEGRSEGEERAREGLQAHGSENGRNRKFDLSTI